MALSILIVLAGGIAYLALPVSQYPEMAPPTVQISATYPGADPETLAETVATPIEEQVNGVENMLYISSQMTNNGAVTITVTSPWGQTSILTKSWCRTGCPLRCRVFLRRCRLSESPLRSSHLT